MSKSHPLPDTARRFGRRCGYARARRLEHDRREHAARQDKVPPVYGRDHEINIAGKPALLASSDPHYCGDPSRHNPEDLLLAAISGCHLLWYLHFCSDSQIIVVSYQDEAEATMEVAADGNGRFTKAVLRPQVTITSTEKIPLAEHLHEKAHKFCFIANSVNFPITVEPRIEIRHG